MDIEGNHNDFTSFKDALQYLRRYPYGTVHHEDMDNLAFIYLKNDGQLAFLGVEWEGYNVLSPVFKDELLTEQDMDYFSDPDSWAPDRFYYLPGYEMSYRNDGVAWFDSLREDLSLSIPALG